ncbi:MAG TPA: zinc metalloprotease HtpX [Kofleriaceae bacterium]|jgi:heat shock protein HtpX|nr:zinc metalloprotease HtpX [Kofleriaceae bacterium]
MTATATRTALLMAALIALLGIGGWAFAGSRGLVAMALVGLAINFGAYWFSDRLALLANGAQPVSRDEAPALYAIVESLTAQAGMPMPSIHLIPSPSPNAFATGRGPDHAAVAVTEGLLRIVDRRELTGVLAHELSHVRNRDVLVATVAAGIAGVISTIGYALQFGLMFGGLSGNDREDRRGSPLAMIAWVVVAPIIAMLLQLAISRAREYGADASGARLTGDPDGLADALERIEGAAQRRPDELGGPATAHLFIVNPLRGRSMLSWLSTHPPVEDRVARLRAMAGGGAP